MSYGLRVFFNVAHSKSRMIFLLRGRACSVCVSVAPAFNFGVIRHFCPNEGNNPKEKMLIAFFSSKKWQNRLGGVCCVQTAENRSSYPREKFTRPISCVISTYGTLNQAHFGVFSQLWSRDFLVIFRRHSRLCRLSSFLKILVWGLSL